MGTSFGRGRALTRLCGTRGWGFGMCWTMRVAGRRHADDALNCVSLCYRVLIYQKGINMTTEAHLRGIDLEALHREAFPARHTWVSLVTGARLTALNPDSLRRHVRKGVVASIKLSGRLMVSEEDCHRLRGRRDRLST